MDNSTLPFIDFHTHHASVGGEKVIRDGVDTWGIHPWHACDGITAPMQSVMAIGECGLDRVCATPWDVQLKAFEYCVQESEKRGLPLVLHCVRAIDDCLAVRRRLKASQPWIWHGYRGNATQLRQLLAKGFYFSFGQRYRVDALHECPTDRLLIETDDAPIGVSEVYRQVAVDLGVDMAQLKQICWENFLRLFGKG